MASFRETWIGFMIIGLFIFAMLSFVVITQSENGLNQSILDDGKVNKTYSDINLTLNSLASQVQTNKDSFDSEDPERGFGSLIIFSIVGVIKNFGGIMVTIYNIIIVLPASILGVPEAVISVLSAILLFSIVLLLFKTIRIGE